MTNAEKFAEIIRLTESMSSAEIRKLMRADARAHADAQVFTKPWYRNHILMALTSYVEGK